MFTETVLSFFDDWWAPVTGLTPTISGRWIDGTVLFTWVMSESGGGWYSYVIQNYNKLIIYLITADWGGTLSDGARYQYISNTLDSYPNKEDWKGGSGLVIDTTAIAREVWAIPATEPIKGSYGEAVQKEYVFDYERILDSFKKVSDEVGKVSNSLSESSKEKESDKKIVQLIANAMEGIKDIHASILTLSNDNKERHTAIQKGMINTLKKWISQTESVLNDYIQGVNDVKSVADILWQYTDMVQKMLWGAKPFEKLTYITLLMEDVLAKVSK